MTKNFIIYIFLNVLTNLFYKLNLKVVQSDVTLHVIFCIKMLTTYSKSWNIIILFRSLQGQFNIQ